MKISDHITYAEAIHSQTAKRKGIDNTPNPNQIEAMKLLAEKVFEVAGWKPKDGIKLRTDKPVGVMFRCCDNSKMLSYYKPKISLFGLFVLT